jgi:transposase
MGYRSVDRGQGFLLPPDMREWLPAGHLVWLLIEAVRRLDLSGFHAGRRLGGVGREGYDPQMLVTLLIYGYAHGVYSSRAIERACEVDVAFRVICAQDPPDHSTLARFRQQHREAVGRLFTEVLRLCARAGLGRVGTVAVDGTKIAANASLAANRTEEELRAEVDRRLGAAAAIDAAEDRVHGPRRGDELPTELIDPAGRTARITRLLEEMAAERAAADRDDTSGGTAGRAAAKPSKAGTDPAVRAAVRAQRAAQRLARARARAEQQRARTRAAQQAAHDAGYFYSGPRDPKPVEQYALVRRAGTEVVVAKRAERAAVRRARRAGSMQPVRAPKKKPPRRNVTDPDSRIMPVRGGGWIQGYNAQLAVSEDQIILAAAATTSPADTAQFEPMMSAAVHAAAVMAAAAGDDRGVGVVLADAGYASDDNLTAAGPDRLIALGKRRHQEQKARDNPARGQPAPDASPRQAMDHRLRTEAGAALYQRRAAIVEPVFGHLKERRGFRRILRRGLGAAQAELELVCLTHNLLKLARVGLPA